MFTNEPIDYSDPRSVLEEKEEEQQSAHDMDSVALATALGRVLAWLVEGKSLPKVGLRVYVVAHKLRPDLVNGMSFEAMASQLGQGRSSAHKLSKEFAAIFGVRGMHDKSDDARRKYREAWKRTHFQPCPTTNSPPPRQLTARSG